MDQNSASPPAVVAPPRPRFAYDPPRLTVYGPFTRLTAAGSGLTGENANSNNRNRRL